MECRTGLDEGAVRVPFLKREKKKAFSRMQVHKIFSPGSIPSPDGTKRKKLWAKSI